ncbi:nitroreductase family protein [Gordonia terrae]
MSQDPTAGASLGALEVIGSARSMRYLKPDPVPMEMLKTLVWAGTRAPSPVNSQPWHFVIVTDPAVIGRLGAAVVAGLTEYAQANPSDQPVSKSGAHLAATVGQVPAMIVVGAELSFPPEDPDELYAWACVFPASQNILLAARALGLGAAFTTYHHFAPDSFRDELNLPAELRVGTVIPVGWPGRAFGPVRRRPVDDVIHIDRWDNSKTGSFRNRAFGP